MNKFAKDMLQEAYQKLKFIQSKVNEWISPYRISQVNQFIQDLSEVMTLLQEIEADVDEIRLRIELHELISIAGKRSEYNLVALSECAHILEAYLGDNRVASELVASKVHEVRHRLNQSIQVLRQLGEDFFDNQDRAIDDGAEKQNFAEKKLSKRQSALTSSDQRCADLTENIRETLGLLKLYEEQRRLSTDPKEKRRVEQEITDLQEQLSAYEAEVEKLGCTSS